MRRQIDSHDTEQAGATILRRSAHAAVIGNRYPRRSRLACVRLEAAGDYRHRRDRYQWLCGVDQVQAARVVMTIYALKTANPGPRTSLMRCSGRRCGIGKHH